MRIKKKVIAISGSTRHNSTNSQIIKVIADLTNEKLELILYDGLVTLPYFNPDLNNENAPEIVKEFRTQIQEADGVLICSPEYVFSIPGILKNAIEWTVSTNVFTNKPLAIITAAASGEKAHESLILIMTTLGVRFGRNTTLLIQGPKGKINNDGKITDESTLQKLNSLINSFIESMNLNYMGA